MKTNTKGKQVAVVIGATSKWQSDGRNTLLAHGRTVDDSDLPVGIRWGVGGAIAQKFAREGFFVVLTTRHAATNATALEKAIGEQSVGNIKALSRKAVRTSNGTRTSCSEDAAPG